MVHYKTVNMHVWIMLRTWPNESPVLRGGNGFRAIVYSTGIIDLLHFVHSPPLIVMFIHI